MSDLRGSVEKVTEVVEEILTARLGSAMACLVLPQIQIPKDDQELDGKLEEWAALVLELRSDDAPKLEVSHAAAAALGS